ncbi:hypothetical protein B0H11DRAFT_1929176 [Mycena galericulata]|nr:hypothetical protein B0H11DRAFT_1929176 [Mycena galericulata]
MDLALQQRAPEPFTEYLSASDDLVGTSQPFQDGEEDLRLPSSSHSESVDDSDIVCSSQPFDDEMDLLKMPFETLCASTSHAATTTSRRARLIRRAPPAPPGEPCLTPYVRSGNLVRRCSTGPSKAFLQAREMERKRQEARDKARNVMKKIRALATATAQLRRKHRRLCTFLSETSANKENVHL